MSDRFVAAGGSDTIGTSLDGVSWQVTTLPERYGELSAVTAIGSRAVVTGAGGLILTWR